MAGQCEKARTKVKHKTLDCENRSMLNSSMRLKTRSTFPPGGWVFTQPQTGWDLKFGKTFDQAVEAIITHRRSNPRFNLPTEFNDVAAELEAYTIARIKTIPNASSLLINDDLPGKSARPSSTTPAAHAGAVAGTVAGAKKLGAGVRVLIDWVGSGGKPVGLQLATDRARVCVACSKNRKSNWSEWAKDKIAESIKAQLEIKGQMRMNTPFDDSLMTCDACLCWLPLKVHTPLGFILSHQSEAVRTALDPSCWILSEQARQ